MYLFVNNITEITGLDNLVNLQELRVNCNKITEIRGLDNLVNLRDIWFYVNNITEITGLDNLINLQKLYLSNNKITEIPMSIMNLRRLTDFKYDYVNIKISPIIERFLDRNRIKNNKLTIYDDNQNIHDTSINKSITNSIFKIMNDKLDINADHLFNEIISDLVLIPTIKGVIIDYSKNEDVHSVLNITFKELLLYIWNIIRKHPDKDDIKEILNQEMKDSLCKCFTGRMSRLVNCLNGFDNRVEIKISDNSQLSNLIIMLKNKYGDANVIRQEFIKEATERGFDKEVINEWVEYID